MLRALQKAGIIPSTTYIHEYPYVTTMVATLVVISVGPTDRDGEAVVEAYHSYREGYIYLIVSIYMGGAVGKQISGL